MSANIVVKRISYVVGVRTEGCCQSMRCLVTLLRRDLCRTTFYGTSMGDESDGNDDVDRMDDMVADTRRGYDLESEDPPSEVQNFYMLLAASEEKCTMAPM